MLKPESIVENETHKIIWNFEIQIDHLIPARRPDLAIVNQKKRELAVQWILLIQQTTERKSKKAKRETSTWTLPETEKAMEH